MRNKYFNLYCKAFIVSLLLATSLSTFCKEPETIDSEWFKKNYIKKELYLTMRDGVKLFTTVYYPKSKSERHPFLLTRTPYSCRPYGDTVYSNFYVEGFRKEYCRERYIFVIQDVRGRWMSEDEFLDVRPFIADKTGKQTDEASDTYDTVEQLLKLIPNNNGRVGVVGTSYPGFFATMAAASAHPAIKAVSPQAPVTNWFIGDDWHHNGALMLMDVFGFYSGVSGGFGVPHRSPTQRYPSTTGYPIRDLYKFFLEAGALKNLTAMMGDTIRFWDAVVQHPNFDAWWKERDARNAMHNLQPAMLWVGGNFDAEDCWGGWHSYLAAEALNPDKHFNRIVEGPWWHGQWSAADGSRFGNILFDSNTSEYFQQNIEIPFFNYYLKDKGSVDSIAEATVFFTGSNQWRKFDRFPPEEQTYMDLYLLPNGSLCFEKPSEPDSYTEYVSDPAKPVPYGNNTYHRTREYMLDDQRFASRRTDVLTFQTDTLQEDVTIVGTVVADLMTSISTTDADFVVKLIDVFPDCLFDNYKNHEMEGYQMMVRGEVFRGRYRNSFETPEAFTPGKVERVRFDMPPTAHCFRRGHRIMLQIQSSWFPLVDRNPQQFVDIYHCDDADFVKSQIRIHHDALNSSKIVLPVLP